MYWHSSDLPCFSNPCLVYPVSYYVQSTHVSCGVFYCMEGCIQSSESARSCLAPSKALHPPAYESAPGSVFLALFPSLGAPEGWPSPSEARRF